jgi:ribulose-5-phosphate 4-epimerase/fuculose-1-phosphate aldolase
MISNNPQFSALSEGEVRVRLAACYRLAAHFQMTDLIYTHITAKVPGREEQFLINPYGMRWEEITASSLVKIDLQGNKIDLNPYRVNPAGFTIHSAVHMSRSDAHWVMHTHTQAGVAVSCLEDGLLPLNQIALQFYGRVAYHDFEGIALELEERERIIRDFRTQPVLILRNHGLLSVGRSAAQMFNRMYYLNRACEIQVSALSMGRPLQKIPADVCSHVAEQCAALDAEDSDLQLEWDAHMRMLDAIDGTYRD